jgi:2-C-methyl-D-erythritol 4-phosphate cytidylyltransferase
MSYYALVPAAGSGARMGGETPKQYLPLAGHPLIWHALSALCAVSAIQRVFVVLAPDDELWSDAAMADCGEKLVVLRCGGETRAQSVANGLRAMAEQIPNIAEDWVLVHDAARPCLTVAHVETLIHEVGDDSTGGILAVPVADTLKRASGRLDDHMGAPSIMATVARDGLWQAQTPQMFRHRLLLDALDFAPRVTDEASAIEALGLHPRLVKADSTNFKVTYPHDLELAALILDYRSRP